MDRRTDISAANSVRKRERRKSDSASIMNDADTKSVTGSQGGGSPTKDVSRVGSWAADFDKLLSDPAGLQTFAEFLKKEFSHENIYFWCACEKFKSLDNGGDRLKFAKEVIERHLETGASEPVNVDSVANSSTQDQLSSASSENPPSLDLFKTAQTQIYNLMKFDSFCRFLKSDLYKDSLLADMAGNALPYTGEDLEVDLMTSTVDLDKSDSSSTVSCEFVEFRAKDIRYKSEAKEIIKETALSLFIFSPRPHPHSVTNFINTIKNLKRCTSYARFGECDKLVRIDFVFKDELFQKLFRNKVEAIDRPQDLSFQMKAVSEDVLLHTQEPVLEEKELLSVLGDCIHENIFHGFSVKIRDSSNNLLFEFDSMINLNTFLTRTVGVEDGYLGKVRDRDMEPQLASMRKYRKTLYPLRVKLDSCFFDWEKSMKEYKFQESKNKRSRTEQYTTIDFLDKKDLFHFVANEPVCFMFKFKKI